MILRAELKEIGHLQKPHGINGEITATSVLDAGELAALRCVVLEIDGIFVPFFISATRQKSTRSALLTIDGINSEAEAARLCPAELYALREDISRLEDASEDDSQDIDRDSDDAEAEEGEGFYAEDLVGYTVESDDGLLKGEIVELDDSTDNYLFIVRDNAGRRIMLPVADGSMIESIDQARLHITLSLPNGLLDINN